MCTKLTTNENDVKPLVSIQFVEILMETAQETMGKGLKKLGAPEEMITLATNIFDLAYYIEKADKPGIDFGPEGFDIQRLVIETANMIADLGGTFTGSGTVTIPRKGTFLERGAEGEVEQ